MKKLGLVVTIFSLMLFGGNVDVGYTEYMQSIKEESAQDKWASLNMTFNPAPVLEYSSKTFDPADMVASHTGELEVLSDPFELKSTGIHTLKYRLTDVDEFGQEVSKDYKRYVYVKDTVGPTITLKESDVSVIIGNGYNPASNISVVSDPVDGNLRLSNTLEKGTYVVEGSVSTGSIGTYNVNVKAMDMNGNTSSKTFRVAVSYGVYYGTWTGQRLTPTLGTINGPSGKETYYNLNMSGVIAIMRRMGNTDPYWVREDGCKMLGPYIMVAAHLGLRPRGSLVETSLGTGIVCDTGGFALTNPYQIDIAVNW